MVIADLGDCLNITEPCRLCRKESATVTGGKKYCIICYKELITNELLKRAKRS